MDLPNTKRKLIDRIEATADELLLNELLEVLVQHDAATHLSEDQTSKLRARIDKVEEGRAIYTNAKEEALKIKQNLNEIRS